MVGCSFSEREAEEQLSVKGCGNNGFMSRSKFEVTCVLNLLYPIFTFGEKKKKKNLNLVHFVASGKCMC